MNQAELESWRRATLTLVTLALVVFFSQRFLARTFDVAFEVCVFYVPAGTLITLYFYFKNKLRTASVKPPA